ncbi:MAG: N-formylglutamate amidohydrolase [Sphingomonas bacterium]|nr:N-formylglutamate amidohydrolase [Sphingomonas bacterium]
MPHSGRDYDPALLARARLGRASLERLEDPLVDQLVEGALDRGVGAVIARAPRALIDLNRAEDDLDPATIAGRTGEAPTLRARAGLGLLPSRLAGLGDLWRAPLAEDELVARIASVHRPYHAALTAALERLARSWGEVVLIDCHSMPPRARGEANVVIGDRHGTSAAKWVSVAADRIASRLGFAVAHNAPFAGGHIVARHGAPQRGIHAIQIEVDRAAYCQRDARTAGTGFDRVAMLFEALSVELASIIEQRGVGVAAE